MIKLLAVFHKGLDDSVKPQIWFNDTFLYPVPYG